MCEDVHGSQSTSHMATVLDSPVQEVHRDGVPPRFGQRVVLVPGSPDAPPQSIQDRFLADEDPLSVEVMDALERGLAVTQWEPSASFSVPSVALSLIQERCARFGLG